MFGQSIDADERNNSVFLVGMTKSEALDVLVATLTMSGVLILVSFFSDQPGLILAATTVLSICQALYSLRNAEEERQKIRIRRATEESEGLATRIFTGKIKPPTLGSIPGQPEAQTSNAEGPESN